MIHQHSTSTEITFGWDSSTFEIYASFGPYVSKSSGMIRNVMQILRLALVVVSVNNLLRWIQREEDELFVTELPVL